MKKQLLVAILLWVPTAVTLAQNVGLSFSYFIPTNGSFSIPISPFSVRGVGFDLNRYLAVETGFTLYRMSGLNVKDLPFESKKSLSGPNFTTFVPLELVLQFKGKQTEFDLKAGGFFFYAFGQQVNLGNMDRALARYQSWDIANADLDFENNPGLGFHFGGEFTITITRQFGISFEVNYLNGSADFPLSGNVTGGLLGGVNQTVPANFEDAKIDFRGLEFSFGVIFTGR